MNHVLLSGRVATDIKKHFTQNGKSVAHFNFAVQKSYKKDEDGNYRVDFFRIEAWDGLADTVEAYVGKGDRLNIQGRLAKEVYDKDGERRESVKVVANNIEFLSPIKVEDASASASPIPPRDEIPAYGDDYPGDSQAVSDEEIPW